MNSNSKTSSWFLAARPKTLLAAFAPVFVGSALAYKVDSVKFNLFYAFLTLLCSVLIQVGTNFVNDLYDFLKGADNEDRKGPLRVLASGLISVNEMKAGIIITFGLAFIIGLVVVFHSTYVLFILGVLSLFSGYIYTAGPYPLAYHGLGDIFVFLFFGVVGTMGSYYVHINEFTAVSFLASIPVGALITNILVVNNYRDAEEDKETGKNTLAVIWGRKFSRFQLLACLILSYIIPVILVEFYGFSIFTLLPLISIPVAIIIVKMIYVYKGIELNKTLELTAKLSALYGLLFSIGLVI